MADRTTDHAWLTISVQKAPILIGTISLMPADNVRGMRADTIALLKQLNAPVYRWPGGNFVSGYDWRDGIGERDHRPPCRNPAWTGVEHNDVGIDEFIAFCREVGAEPMIAANTGFGDDYSAAQEVEYCNATADTIGGSWRTKNGHSEPFHVKYWCVGNEMYGNWQLGHLPLEQYTQKHNRFATAMRKVDANLVLVGSSDLDTQATLSDGDQRRQVNWSQGMLERCADHMNLISEHFYRGRVPWSKEPAAPILRHVSQLKEAIRAKAQGHLDLQQKLGRQPADFIPIDMDEWNYWHQPYEYGELGCKYDLADGLGVAAGLHEYSRNSDIIHAAMYAQTVNVIGCIKTTKTAAFFETTALPLLLYRREFGTIPLKVTGDQEAQALDIAAARTADGGAITIGIVNPNGEPQAISTKLTGAKAASNVTLWRIAGNDPKTFNTPDRQPIKIEQTDNASFGDEFTLPPYSINLYRVSIENAGN